MILKMNDCNYYLIINDLDFKNHFLSQKDKNETLPGEKR